MYWHEFKAAKDPERPDYFRHAKARALKHVKNKLLETGLQAKPLTTSMVMHKVNNQGMDPIYVFRVELRVDLTKQDRIYREVLSADRYKGFYLYVIDISGETDIFDWSPDQTSKIMTKLIQVKADPILCIFLRHFLTIENYGRGGNRQIERLLTSTEEIEAIKASLSISSRDNPSNLLLNVSVPGAHEDFDCFTTIPTEAEESFNSIKKHHHLGASERKDIFEIIIRKIKESLETQQKAKDEFENAAKEKKFPIELDFSYASVIDETIIFRKCTLTNLAEVYDQKQNFDGQSMITDRHLVDHLINKSRCEVREVPGGLRIICTQKDKVAIDSSKLLDKIYQENGEGKAGTILIANYVTGDGKIRLNAGASRSIIFEDIDFHGDMVLNEAIFHGSLTFRRCRFLGRFSAKDASIEGSLTIQRCILHGSGGPGFLNTEEGEETQKRKSTLLAHGLFVAKSFFIISSTIFGRVKGQWLQVGNILELRDTRIYDSEKQAGSKQDLVKLGYARVGGPVVLTSSLDNFSGTFLRGYLGGHCHLPGLKADSLHISGLCIHGKLDLEAARIQSTIAIEKLTNPNKPCSGWLTHIGQDLILHYAHCELLQMDDIHILGKLDLEEAEIEHSCKLAASFDSGGRSIIHGDAIFDGATINGDISMRGAHIGGELRLITGSFGRIYANATWVKYSRLNNHCLRILETEIIGDIYLADCKTGALALVGIKVEGSIITNNLLVNGRIRFWGPKRNKIMMKEAMERAGCEFKIDVIKEMTKGITAKIERDINLANASVSGGIDFSKLTAKSINLDDATLNGGLNFYTDSSQGDPVKIKNGISMKGITINGEIDARGLKIACGDFNAKDSTIKGEILFANRDGKEGETLILEVGNIELEGLTAPSLWVSDSCLAEDNQKKNDRCQTRVEQKNKAATAKTINLSRTKLGQLTVYGLWRKEGLYAKLNLYAAKVEDWNLVNKDGDEEHELCLVLLSATKKYFDARNYLDIENRLHAIGRTSLSNSVYREMGIKINQKNTNEKLGNKKGAGELKSNKVEGDEAENEEAQHSIFDKIIIFISHKLFSAAKILQHGSSRLLNSNKIFIQWLAFILTPFIVLISYLIVRPLISTSRLLLGNYSKPISQTNAITSEAINRTSDGFLFNWIFTHGRTKPGLMFLWLFLLSLPAIIIACDNRNIIAPNETVSTQKSSTHEAYEVTTIVKRDGCPVTQHVIEQDWNYFKSLGIAATYAVPFYQSAKIDEAKLRTTGCTYVWGGTITWASPHDIPQIFSMLQFALWILIAANLPAIIRRRS